MIEGKIFPNVNAANGALNAAQNTWTPPSYVDVGGGRHRSHALLAPQVLSIALELDDATWFVIANHPGFKGDFITGPERIKPIQANNGQGQGVQAQSVGAM